MMMTMKLPILACAE